MNHIISEETLSGLAKRFLSQDQDLAFAFSGATGDFSVVGFDARETINAPFEISIHLASGDPSIDLHALIDAPACLGIYNKYDEVRYLHGIVTEVERGDSGIRRTFYSVTLRPTLSRLDHGSDSRIWQAKTVPDIVSEVFKDYGITDVEWRLNGQHAPREYCTQYRETHRAFIERLLSEEGILYYFEHSDSSHKLILTDAPLAAPMLPAAPKIEYNPRTGGQNRGSWISAFSQREKLRSSTYEMNDYTFKNPPANQRRNQAAQENNGLQGDYALYDYPGRYKDPRVGAPFTKHRIESVRVDATTGHGETNNIQLCPGFHFELTGHDDGGANSRHRILSVQHSGTQSAALEEDAGGGATTYKASFTTMPGHLPYRPPLAQKPLVDGPQIAHVTGPEGEEIYCDEFGRIKVWFPWDRYGEKNENSSCWIRVSQNWAGGAWGHMAIPRIGHEVIVDYLEGDPDQPIVTGRTYHATNRPPYGLPENKTRMTIKSQTHKGEGYNEFRFEDEADREEVFMHAQKDHNTIIENNETHQIGNDRSKTVAHDQSESVGNDKTITVKNDHTENIGNDMTYSVGRNQQEKYGKDHIHTVGNIHKQSIYADHLYETGRNYEGSVSGAYKLDVGKTITTNTGTHTLMAFEKFVIKGPGGKIVIDSSGITLEAAKINLKGAVSMGGSGSAQVPTLSMAANEGLPICEECAKKAAEE
ncbi:MULTISPECIES: type VI secretion system Vgr family protein [unclassified Thalassospira]|uniref:type VI secretion system Vgr family protein n=1 Tax=unclassified Thalassospira TaxID=2648997 RepID=UPI000A200041|nr:type VI secretion system Vgr family protein [Thalassospira sp. MCCC 1A01428]